MQRSRIELMFLLLTVVGLVSVAQADLPVGTLAPDFTLPTTQDSTITLSQFRGQVVILAFWKAD